MFALFRRKGIESIASEQDIINTVAGKNRKGYFFKNGERFKTLNNYLNNLNCVSSYEMLAKVKESKKKLENNYYLKRTYLNPRCFYGVNYDIKKDYDQTIKTFDMLIEREEKYLKKKEKRDKIKRIIKQKFLKLAFYTAVISSLSFNIPNRLTNSVLTESDNALLRERYKMSLLVDIANFRLEVYLNNKKIKECQLAVGKPSTQTPIGDFKIESIEEWDGNYAGSFLQFKKCIIDKKEWGGWGIHGWYSNWCLGHALSKGCVRINAKDGLYLRKNVMLDTPVKIKYETININRSANNLAIVSDIYSKNTNTLNNIIEKLKDAGFSERAINREKIKLLLEKVDENTRIYKETADNLYAKLIKPLKENVVYPELYKEKLLQDSLKLMEEHKQEVVSLDELLTPPDTILSFMQDKNK